MGVTCCLRTSREPESPSRTSKSPSCTFYPPRTTMSWQSYVDDQLISTNMIKNAVIAGHDGNIWASSSGFNVLEHRPAGDERGDRGGDQVHVPLRQRQGGARQEGPVWRPLHQDCASPDCLRLRGARGARAGGHRDGEAGRVPHLRRLLADQLPCQLLATS